MVKYVVQLCSCPLRNLSSTSLAVRKMKATSLWASIYSSPQRYNQLTYAFTGILALVSRSVISATSKPNQILLSLFFGGSCHNLPLHVKLALVYLVAWCLVCDDVLWVLCMCCAPTKFHGIPCYDDTSGRTGMAQAIHTVIVMRGVCTATAPKLIYMTILVDIRGNLARFGVDSKSIRLAHQANEFPWRQLNCDGLVLGRMFGVCTAGR